MKKISYLLMIMFVIGAALRFYGLSYGLPYLYHPDEVRQVLDALSMGQRFSIIPLDLTYPALHKYMLLLVYGVYFAAGKLFGAFSSSFDFAGSFFQNSFMIFYLSRLVSLLFGLLLSVVIYVITKNVFNDISAIVSFLFSLFMYQLIGHSQYAIADIIVTFFTTTAICFILLEMKYMENMYFYTACIFMGLGISTKANGGLVILPMFISQIYIMAEYKLKFVHIIKKYFTGGLLCFVFLSIGNIAFLNDPISYISKIKVLSGVIKMGISSAPTFSGGFIGLLLWFSKELIRQETIIGIFILAGIVFSFLRHDKYDVVCLSYLFVFFFLMRNWGFRYLHLFTASFGIMCIIAGRCAGSLIEYVKSKRLKYVIYAVLSVGVILSISRGVYAGLLKSNQDTRIEAKKWIEENIPQNSIIGLDWYGFGPPILGSVPVVMNNTPNTVKFYKENLSCSIQTNYANWLENNSGLYKYDLCDLMYSSYKPIWPSDMPKKAIDIAKDNEYFRELYSWFNYLDPDEVKKQKVNYVVLSSYSYSLFLLNNDPRKKDLFNPYIYEDMQSSNRQADYYDDKSLCGILYFLTKRAREFYLRYLNEEDGIVLIREFVPKTKQLGPIVRIYRL